MAKALPSAQDLGVVGVQPSLAVASYKGATGGEDDAARGMIVAGGQFGAAAAHLEKAQQDFDNLQAEDRFNQYQERLNQIALDPQTGWKNQKGEHALKGDFNKRYSDRFEDERKKFADTMDSPGAKQRFAQLSASAAMRHRASLYEHSAQERVAYDGKVTNDTLKGIRASAWENHANDELFDANRARGQATIERFAAAQGLNAESTKLAVREFESSLWTDRIEAAVAAGNLPKAKEMMGKVVYDKLLTTADKEKLDAKIKPQLTIAEAQEKVGGVFANLVPADPNAPFPALAVDAALRKEFAGNPEALRIARQEADYRRGLVATQQRESNSANLAAVMKDLHVNKKSPADVMRSDAFSKLDGTAQAQFIQHVDTLRTQAAARDASYESRAATAEARQLHRLNIAGQAATLMYLMNPPDIAKMSANDIVALGVTIGPDNAARLAQAKVGLEKPGAMQRQTMTNQLFKTIVADYMPGANVELLTKAAKTDGQRETQATLSIIKQNVDERIQEKANSLKRPLTLDEQETIMREAMKQEVILDRGTFTPNQRVPVISLPSSGPKKDEYLKQVVLPLDQVDPMHLEKWYNFIRANRAGAERKTDDQIRGAFGSVLERAAGVRAAGGSPEMIEKILKGPDK